MSDAFSIEPSKSYDSEPCVCCGDVSRCVVGYTWRNGVPLAAYYVHWTLDHVREHGAHFDLILGEWGDSTTAQDRFAVSLDYRLLEGERGFMVIDAQPRAIAENVLVGRALDRSDIVGRPIAQDIFALCDAILEQDPRLAELVGGPTSQH